MEVIWNLGVLEAHNVDRDGEIIYHLLSVADTGWWISYEGENNGFAEMTE